MKKITKRLISSDTILFISAGFYIADTLQYAGNLPIPILKSIAILLCAWIASAAIASFMKLGES